jgi:hypothetical protein
MQHPIATEARQRFRSIERALRSRVRSAVALPKPQALRIDRTTTSWVFISASNDPRHLSDVVFGVHALRARSVPRDHIHVCSSHPEAAQYLNPYGIRNIHPIEQLGSVLAGLSCEILVLVVGGHGTVDGAGQGEHLLRPAEIVSKARGIAGLRAGVIVLGQCFAGAFNLMDAETHPPLVLIGATNLNASLSQEIKIPNKIPQEDGTPLLDNWFANVFLLNFFYWIGSQSDIDGDGELTILDAFKFAGASSNSMMVKAKSILFRQAFDLSDQITKLRQQAPPQDPQQVVARVLQIGTLDDQLREALNALYLHQEPWILHAKLARRLVVAL